MYKSNFVQDNDGKHIQKVMDNGTCRKHGAPAGVPCFHIPKEIGSGYYAGVCGGRIKHAGYNGKVSQEATRTKPKSDYNDRPSRPRPPR